MGSVIYPYTAADPRERPAHYMYAPFEGRPLFEALAADRQRLLESLPGGDAISAAPSAPQTFPSAIDTSDCLARCASLVAAGKAASNWDEFFLKKIEIHRRLRAAYGADGRMTDNADAGADAYAFAALLFAERSTPDEPHDGLRWLNACLKSLDVLSVIGGRELSAFGAACAKRAIEREQSLIDGLATRHRIGWP